MPTHAASATRHSCRLPLPHPPAAAKDQKDQAAGVCPVRSEKPQFGPALFGEHEDESPSSELRASLSSHQADVLATHGPLNPASAIGPVVVLQPQSLYGARKTPLSGRASGRAHGECPCSEGVHEIKRGSVAAVARAPARNQRRIGVERRTGAHVARLRRRRLRRLDVLLLRVDERPRFRPGCAGSTARDPGVPCRPVRPPPAASTRPPGDNCTGVATRDTVSAVHTRTAPLPGRSLNTSLW